MVRSHSFAVLRLSPSGARGERLNIGVLVFGEDGLEVRLAHRLDKVRAISSAVDQRTLRALASRLEQIDADGRLSGVDNPSARRKAIERVGPLSLSELGSFTSLNDIEYQYRLDSVLKALVEPEPAPKSFRPRKSKLLTELKAAFRLEKVLARRDENLLSHRIVSNLELAKGLVADLALRNGAMHVIETVDVSSDEVSPRKAVSDVAVAALVLEQARINYGDDFTRARLVYNATSAMEDLARPSLEAAAHQGTELVNWASGEDRNHFIDMILSLAVPYDADANSRPAAFPIDDIPRLRLR